MKELGGWGRLEPRPIEEIRERLKHLPLETHHRKMIEANLEKMAAGDAPEMSEEERIFRLCPSYGLSLGIELNHEGKLAIVIRQSLVWDRSDWGFAELIGLKKAKKGEPQEGQQSLSCFNNMKVEHHKAQTILKEN